MSNESNRDRPDDYVRTNRNLIPKGNYVAVIDKVEKKETQKGGDYIDVTLKISVGDYAGRVAWAKYYYSENAISWLWDMLLDIERPDISASKLLDNDSERGKLIDTVVNIYVKHDIWDGNTSAKAKIKSLASVSDMSSENTNAPSIQDEEDVPF